MRIIANRQLYGSSYGSLHTDEGANVPDYIAVELIKRGLARSASVAVQASIVHRPPVIETQDLKSVEHQSHPSVEMPKQAVLERPTVKLQTKAPATPNHKGR